MDILSMIMAKHQANSRITGGYSETKRIHFPDDIGLGVLCESPFNSIDELIGSKVSSRIDAYVMKSELERPDERFVDTCCLRENIGSFGHGLIFYTHGDFNGYRIFDKPCLIFEIGNLLSSNDETEQNLAKRISPIFTKAYQGYDTLVYAYETTNDALGLGISVQKGWYAANSNTLSFVPFEIDKYPIFFFKSDLDSRLLEVINDEYGQYFYQIAPYYENYDFVITKDRISSVGSDDKNYYYVINIVEWDEKEYGWFFSVFDLSKQSEILRVQTHYVAFRWEINHNGNFLYGSNHSATLHYSVDYPIDPKYIPAMDSITLNGADGKQYEVTVDANGALVTTVKGDSETGGETDGDINNSNGEAFTIEFRKDGDYDLYDFGEDLWWFINPKVPKREQLEMSSVRIYNGEACVEFDADTLFDGEGIRWIENYIYLYGEYTEAGSICQVVYADNDMYPKGVYLKIDALNHIFQQQCQVDFIDGLIDFPEVGV